MKTAFAFLILFAAFVLSGCEKNVPEPVAPTTDTSTQKEQLLTAATWIYNEYFTEYNSKSATVGYKIGKPNNRIDLSPSQVSFKEDKTYWETNKEGDTLRGTWKLVENETKLEVKNARGTFTAMILTLNSTSFVWQDVQKNTFARMIPSNFNQMPSVNATKLTGKKWMYTEYFTAFSQESAALAFKRDKPENLLDLSKNRVTFAADGSVAEIDENGSSVPGAWKFISIGGELGMEVRNYAGIFQSAIVHLNDSSLVWYNPVEDRYGKMVVTNPVDTPSVSARAKILCRNTWLYTEYFSGYSQASAQLTFKWDKLRNNPLNLSPNRVQFHLDGTCMEINESGAALSGTWQFLENESKVKVVNSTGAYVSEIIQLDSARFIWYDADHNTYGKMAKSPFTLNHSIDINKLTGKKWIYYEYFREYSTLQSALVYKRERINNSLDLSINIVLFNPNGTFNEINEAGQTINGTWEITKGNQLRTESTAGGTNIASLIQLDDRNLIWHNTSLDRYGKMVVKLQ